MRIIVFAISCRTLMLENPETTNLIAVSVTFMVANKHPAFAQGNIQVSLAVDLANLRSKYEPASQDE